MHRVRDRLVARRTSVINQLRAFLLERGMVFAKTPFKLKQAMPEILENADANLTPRMRSLVSLLWTEWKALEQQIVAMNEEALNRSPLPIQPANDWEFSSWLGLVPKQHSTCGKARLFGCLAADDVG